MRILILIITTLFLTACSNTATQKVASKNGFKHASLPTGKFNVTTYQKITKPQAAVNIYIEGDGRLLTSTQQYSNDPSPRTATVIKLAALDPNPNVVYLARPCQYAPEDLHTVCERRHWMSARYSTEIVAALNQAINLIKERSAATKINLIGFSGGGALAVLIAAQRNDIASIRTVAGNLDLQTMQDFHGSDPLDESLDPLAVATKVQHIPQIHFIGDKDKTVPTTVAKNFSARAQLNPKQVQVLKGVSHHDGWVQQWPTLLKSVP
jgi:dienelactone hydrolase